MTKTCENCGIAPRSELRLRLCSACYQHQHKHGTPRPLQPSPCTNCGRVRPWYSTGECHTCRDHRRRTGEARPKELFTQVECRLCRELRPLPFALVGVCIRCYQRLGRIGLKVERKPGYLPKQCSNCKERIQYSKSGRCHSCYIYWWRTGKERPLKTACSNCRATGQALRAGRCQGCSRYWARYQRERPQLLWSYVCWQCDRSYSPGSPTAGGVCPKCYARAKREGLTAKDLNRIAREISA